MQNLLYLSTSVVFLSQSRDKKKNTQGLIQTLMAEKKASPIKEETHKAIQGGSIPGSNYNQKEREWALMVAADTGDLP